MTIIRSRANPSFSCTCKPRVEFGKCTNLDHPLKLEWLASTYRQYVECWALGKYTLKKHDITKNKMSGESHRLKYGQLIYDYKWSNSESVKDRSIPEIFRSVKYFIDGYFPKNLREFNATLPIPPTSTKARTIPFEVSKKLEKYSLKNCQELIDVTNKKISPSKDLKTKPEKIENLEGKFIIGDSSYLNGVTGILVIDDVYEQGATAEVILQVINKIAPDLPKYFLSIAYLD